MNVEIGAEAALFPEKEYINGILIAVKDKLPSSPPIFLYLIFKNRLYVEGLQYIFYTGAFGHFFTLNFTSKKDVLTQKVCTVHIYNIYN